MPTRLLRYDGVKTITENASKITGKKANIVYHDGRVTFAEILSISGTTAKLKNMRLGKSTIDLTTVSEIIIDSKA